MDEIVRNNVRVCPKSFVDIKIYSFRVDIITFVKYQQRHRKPTEE